MIIALKCWGGGAITMRCTQTSCHLASKPESRNEGVFWEISSELKISRFIELALWFFRIRGRYNLIRKLMNSLNIKKHLNYTKKDGYESSKFWSHPFRVFTPPLECTKCLECLECLLITILTNPFAGDQIFYFLANLTPEWPKKNTPSTTVMYIVQCTFAVRYIKSKKNLEEKKQSRQPNFLAFETLQTDVADYLVRSNAPPPRYEIQGLHDLYSVECSIAYQMIMKLAYMHDSSLQKPISSLAWRIKSVPNMSKQMRTATPVCIKFFSQGSRHCHGSHCDGLRANRGWHFTDHFADWDSCRD